MVHDKNDPDCQGCRDKLMGVHLTLVAWFWWVKGKHPDVHVSWGFRGEQEQHAAFLAGKSKLDFPRSKHNFTLNGMPCSEALDLFTIDQYGVAHWDKKFFETVAKESEAEGFCIFWGGYWKSIKDLDHWELLETLPHVKGN